MSQRWAGVARRLAPLLVAVPALSGPVGLVNASAEGPTVGVSAASADPGQTVLVSARGFTPGTVVNLEVCGASGQLGSAACDVASARQGTADGAGAVTEGLEVQIPPAPCPCVVRASGGGFVATVPITVVGAPVGQVTLPGAPVPARLDVSDVHLEGRGPWTALFGAAPVRQLVVRLRNPGDAPLSGIELAVTVGRGDDPERLVPAPAIEPLEPGASATYRVPLSLGGLAFGSYTARVEVLGGDEPVVLEDRTTVYPWGLGVVLLVAAQLVLLGVRNRLRRRVEVAALRSAAAEAPALPLPLPSPATMLVDLTEPAAPDPDVDAPSRLRTDADVDAVVDAVVHAVVDAVSGASAGALAPPGAAARPDQGSLDVAVAAAPDRPVGAEVPIRDGESARAVVAAAGRLADATFTALARRAVAEEDVLDLVDELETRATSAFAAIVRELDALRAELTGACDDIRHEVAALRRREDGEVEHAGAGLRTALEAVTAANDAELIDLSEPAASERCDAMRTIQASPS